MRTTILIALSLTLVASSIAAAAGRDHFIPMSLRGRYTGHLTIAEKIPIDESNSLTIDARQLLALTFDGKSGVTGITSVTASVPVSPPTIFTCVFTAEGTYEIGEHGLGTATINITPTTACAGPAVLKLSLLIGGRNRNRIDVTIDGASGFGAEMTPVAIIGSGALTEQ